MDFFTNQDNAKKQSKLLGLMFFGSVVGVIMAVYSVYYGLFLVGAGEPFFGDEFIAIGFFVALAITVVALKDWFFMRAGGAAIAESIGGQLIPTSTSDPELRQLLNIVEEIALAASTPVPNVYIVECDSVNAFAAGHKVEDAVIGVTRGAVKRFNRDQMQGVVAHEYAHILNGDSAISMKLMALIGGLGFISTAGYYMLYTRGENQGKRMAFALSLIVIGAIGAFFASLIKMAISRQREYLADATSVQYTRNPDGIAGALKVIQEVGSTVESPKAEQASHMFFSPTHATESMFSSIKGLFSTHPTLESRIERIEGNKQ
ncbi:Zn-dependent protease with chaperone function [Vibrio chagasii]|nr:Zn-dependent protease with chaperone function [Vibrio chagasii]